MLPIVEDARQKLNEGRCGIRAEHDAGISGQQITASFADLADTLLLELIHEGMDFATDGDRSKLENKIALVPHGGYGRRDLAPFSDLDLMLLYRPDVKPLVESFARRLSQNIVDVGFDLGFSSRTPADAVSLGLKDIKIFTSLVESRYLAGSVGIYSKFLSRLARQGQRRPHALVRAVERARIEERQTHGDTAFYLRPNLKKTKGGLRDIQLVRWVGFTKFGKSDLKALYRNGAISDYDFENLMAAYQFLLKLRNEMHFHAGKARDVLGMNEQVRIAELWGYQPQKGVLPVEQFMRDYFDHTSQVVYAAEHTLASAKTRFHFTDWITPFFSQQQEGYFLIGPIHISATKKGLNYVQGNLEGVLHLMSLANLHNKKIDHATWEAIRTSMTAVEEMALTSTSAWRFCSFMSDSSRLGNLLRRLHEMRVLEKIIPAYQHIRCLVQFNEYHKYTVDEHSIRAVEAATEYAKRDDMLGRCYNSIKDKKVLHLALLLHDAGKGYEDDHSIVGAKIAAETADLLNLNPAEKDDLVFLVRQHLMMAHLAFRRDTADLPMVASFAADVGSTEMLKMMFVLTCADLQAVGPDTFNDWKYNLVSQLYFHSLRQLSGTTPQDIAEFEMSDSSKKNFVESLKTDQQEGLAELAQQFPTDFFDVWPGEKITHLLSGLLRATSSELVIESSPTQNEKTFEYLVGKLDQPYSAVFHKITGALTSQLLQILSVDIFRVGPQKIVYRFKVLDPEASEQVSRHRMETVCFEIAESLGNQDSKPTFKKVWGTKEGPSTEQSTLPTRIRMDNSSADHATIIDVFTHDKTGLLYTITQAIHDLGLQISAAKVGTYLDQVVDVFYVTDVDGKKIRELKRIREIKSTLLKRIEGS
ncbi:MAG: [protein-PII] uridylyltransferase [Planctomycetota bacterium]|nr:[protein-PII] uridylyltransferase [Planctomycetota bacterium]